MTPTLNSQTFQTRAGRQVGLKPLDGISATQWANHSTHESALAACQAHVRAWNAQEAQR